MRKRKDHATLLVNFATALGELTAEAMNDLDEEKRTLLARALETGAGHIQLIVIPKPLTVIGTLHATDPAVPPQIIFRIEGDVSTREFHCESRTTLHRIKKTGG